MPGRPLFFYAQWPLGFYNPEGERKAMALSDAGYDVVYVVSTGMRNPGLASVRKAARVGLRKLRHRSGVRSSRQEGLVTGSILVLPPRQVPTVARANTGWVRRQLEAVMPSWGDALAWIRYPTPEVVDALSQLRPGAVVYECVDAHDETPGIVGAWKERFDRAERALVAQTDLAVVPSEALGERLRSMGADVRVVPHGVDAELFSVTGPDQRKAGPITAGYVGTVDLRLDVAAIRMAAERHPDWRFRFFGPVRDGFEAGAITELPNVTVEPAVPHECLGEVIAGFDLGLMPYLDAFNFEYMCPVKHLEFMAAGKPAVARPNRALAAHADLLYFAETPEEFSAQLDRALGEDTPELARRRRAVAEANSWKRRLEEIKHLAMDLAGP
jgi:glycosyltransferase involved in cell wall biosynthesis